jgi:hypothetical protein
VGQPTNTGWKLVTAQSECWFLMMTYPAQRIFITELDARIINEKKRNREVTDAIFYKPASSSPRMTEKNHQNCQYSE